MNQAVVSIQDAYTFQNLFRQHGYKPYDGITIESANNLLRKSQYLPIDKSSEVILADMKIEKGGGVLSFLKSVALSTDNVGLYNVYGRNKEGEYVWRKGVGALYITNYRILMFINSKSEDSYPINHAYQFDLFGVERVWYEKNILVIRSNSSVWNHDICLQMAFPSPSMAQEFGAINDESSAERLNLKQEIAQFKSKSLNAQNLLYQFFLTIIQNNEAREREIRDEKAGKLGETSPKLSTEAVNLLAKLGELRDAGLISENEFNQKKQELLSRF